KTGLTTNSQDPKQVIKIAGDGLLYQFGVSAGKGSWKDLTAHPHAVVNLLMLKNGLEQVIKWAMESIKIGAKKILLIGYKGTNPDFIPDKVELSQAFAFMTSIRKKFDLDVAADDYIRRKLGLTNACAAGFVRIDVYGKRHKCCFDDCEFS
ncbi:MAG: hypothetical protein HQK78_19800, partial [Desulfobacterales bacterium]|nr:hypothetical protein [Desulfobacterales bacterium]